MQKNILLVKLRFILLAAAYKVASYEIGSGKCGIRKVSALSGRIVGGSEAEKGSWPWQVMIQSNGISICGAALISEDYMLTAAHCHLSKTPDMTHHLGAHSSDASDDTAVKAKVHVGICHPSYDPDMAFQYDLCLLKLMNPATFTDYIQPVCLPTKGSIVAINETVTVTGWGDTLGTGSMDVLNQADVLVIGTETCNDWYSDLDLRIPESHFCAGHEEGEIDSCEGDSGGPLVHEEASGNISAYVLRGITSFGFRCAVSKKPGAYVRVTNLTTWIEEKMSDLSSSLCQPTSSGQCGGHVSSETSIRSPTNAEDFHYPSNQNCTWHIVAPLSFKIRFNFTCYFLLEPPGENCEDYVEVADSAGELTRFCGNDLPEPYIVNGRNASITFVSNRWSNYPGFVTEIHFIPSDTTTETSLASTQYTSTTISTTTDGDYISSAIVAHSTRAMSTSTDSTAYAVTTSSSESAVSTIETEPTNSPKLPTVSVTTEASSASTQYTSTIISTTTDNDYISSATVAHSTTRVMSTSTDSTAYAVTTSGSESAVSTIETEPTNSPKLPTVGVTTEASIASTQYTSTIISTTTDNDDISSATVAHSTRVMSTSTDSTAYAVTTRSSEPAVSTIETEPTNSPKLPTVGVTTEASSASTQHTSSQPAVMTNESESTNSTKSPTVGVTSSVDITSFIGTDTTSGAVILKRNVLIFLPILLRTVAVLNR